MATEKHHVLIFEMYMSENNKIDSLGMIARSAALMKLAKEQRVTVRDLPNDIYLKKNHVFRFVIP